LIITEKNVKYVIKGFTYQVFLVVV